MCHFHPLISTRPWGPEKNRQQLPQVLAEIASAGYDGVEIGAQHLDITQPDAFRQLLTRHGLQPVAIHVGGEIYNPQAVQGALDNLERTVVFAAQAGAMFLAFSSKAKENKTTEEFQVEAVTANHLPTGTSPASVRRAAPGRTGFLDGNGAAAG